MRHRQNNNTVYSMGILRCILYIQGVDILWYFIQKYFSIFFILYFPVAKFWPTDYLTAIYSVVTSYSYLIRVTRAREKTTPLLLHLFRRHGCLRTQRFPPQYYTARFVILPQFHFSSDHQISLAWNQVTVLLFACRIPRLNSTLSQWRRLDLGKKGKMNVLKLQRWVFPCKVAFVLC